MEEITVESIKARIKDNLRTTKISNSSVAPTEPLERPILKQAVVIDSVSSKRRLRDRFIFLGLKYKALIKKIPLFNWIARKIYYSMTNTNSKDFRQFIKRIPILGYLLWWVYMVLKTPAKIVMVYAGVEALKERLNELSPKVNGLFDGNRAFQAKTIELASEVKGLRGRGESIEERLNELSPKVDGLFDGNRAFQAKTIELASEVKGLRGRGESIEERLNELSPKVDGLVNDNMAFQAKVVELASEVNGLRNKEGSIEDRVNELSPKVDGLVNGNMAFQAKVVELASEVNGLRNKEGSIEDRLNELSPKVSGLFDGNMAFQTKVIELASEVKGLKGSYEALNQALREVQTARMQTKLRSKQDSLETTSAILKSLDDIIPHIRFLDNVYCRLHDTFYKNWDLGIFMRFIMECFDKSAPILDVGCVNNPLLFNLAQNGYFNLYGIDLKLSKDNIYSHPQVLSLQADLTQTPFKNCQFACVTALSVVEHGVDGELYFSEMSRILKPGGILLTSTDYWPNKVRTSAVSQEITFGLPWKIFSQREILNFIKISKRFGFRLIKPLEFTVTEPVVYFWGKAYTSITIPLEKYSS